MIMQVKSLMLQRAAISSAALFLCYPVV